MDLTAIIFASSLTLLFHLGKVLVKRQIQKNKDAVSIKVLDEKLWKLFSKYIRSKDADWKGFVSCYTCGIRDEYKYFDAGHGLPKASTGSYLKYDERNVKPQCKICNQGKGGMRKEFESRQKLEYGENIINELKRLIEKSLTVTDYQNKISYYTDQLKIINSK